MISPIGSELREHKPREDQLLEYLPPNEKEELRKLITQYGPDQGYQFFKESLAVGQKVYLNRQSSTGSQDSGSPVNGYSPNPNQYSTATHSPKAYHYENTAIFDFSGHGKAEEDRGLAEAFAAMNVNAKDTLSFQPKHYRSYENNGNLANYPDFTGNSGQFSDMRFLQRYSVNYHVEDVGYHMTSQPYSDSAQIVSNCQSLAQSVEDKHQLKADICRYLDSVSMNMLTLSDGVDLICLIQQAFNRTEFSELCTEICHEKPILALVAFLHDNRGYMSNEQRLKTARSLLRLTWSLTYSTISDFLDSLKANSVHGQFTIDELVLFCQCQHNYHLLKNLNPTILCAMGETARTLLPTLQVEAYPDLNEPLYTATVIFKCFGKDFTSYQVNAVAQIFKTLMYYGAVKLSNLHKDGRSTVIHLLDACFRANVLKEHYVAELFQEIYEHCCNEIAFGEGRQYVAMTVQDISAVLRALQDFTSQSPAYFKTLDNVAQAMLKRMQRGEAHAKDFVKNMRNLTAKCFFNESLLENFCALIERDLDEVCHCQRPNCLKSCRSLNFWQIADALDIISTPNYIFRKDEDAHMSFLSKMASQMASNGVWESLMKSFYDNKMQKLFFTLVGFQTYGYYPMQLINSTNFQRYIYDLSHQQHGAQIQRFQKWYDIKEKDFELGSFHPKSGSNSYTIFDCFFSVEPPNGQLYPSEPIHNLQRMERKVLLALSEIKDIEIRQRHGINRKYSHFLVNGDTAVLPISKKRFLRDGNGSIQNLDRVNGRFGTYKRLLSAQYGDKLILVPHYEFEILGGSSDLPSQVQVEYVKEKLGSK